MRLCVGIQIKRLHTDRLPSLEVEEIHTRMVAELFFQPVSLALILGSCRQASFFPRADPRIRSVE